MSTAPIERRLAALEQRTLQPILRVVPTPEDHDTCADDDLMVIATGVPLAVPSATDLLGDLPFDHELVEVADVAVHEPPVAAQGREIAGAPEAPAPPPVRHSLEPHVRVTPASPQVVETGLGDGPAVSHLSRIRA